MYSGIATDSAQADDARWKDVQSGWRRERRRNANRKTDTIGQRNRLARISHQAS
jgi:hypothetical protein